MSLIFIAWLGVVALCWSTYGPLARVFALGTLATASTPFLIAATGLGGAGTDDARRLLWMMLAAWGGTAGAVSAVRRGP